MKLLIFGGMMLLAFLIVWFAAGKLFKRDKVENWITGVYIRLISNDFSKGTDTLTITQQTGTQFRITRRMGYQRIMEGKVFEPEYKAEEWTGIYDEKTKQIHEQQHGKVLSFDKNKLWVGTSEYKKLN
jgi:hypothetical protein